MKYGLPVGSSPANMNRNKLTSWITLTLVVLALDFIPIGGNPDAKRLYDDLLSNYNRLIRPVGNNSDRLTVKMGIKLSQLIDVVSTTMLTLSNFRSRSFLNEPTTTSLATTLHSQVHVHNEITSGLS